MSRKNPIDYQSLFQSLPDSYIAFLPDDPNFTIIAENEAHAKVAGAKVATSLGKPVFDVFPDVSEKYKKTGVSDLLESLRKVIRTGKPDTMATLHYDVPDSKGGFMVKYWKVTHHPVFDADGKVALVYQATEDITETIDSVNKLQITEQRLNEVLSSGLLGTWVWDIAKDVVVGDRYMAAMFGVEPEKATTGVPISEFTSAIHPDDRPRLQKEIAAALKSSEEFNSEYRTLRPDGSIRWILARGRVVQDDKGKAAQFPGVLIDITDRKLVETNLEFLAEAGATLSASLDYMKTLQSIAKLAVPKIADWCTIEMFDVDGKLQTVAVEHKDPAKVQWALELRKRQGPPDLTKDAGLAHVLRTGEPAFYPEITDEMLVAGARSKKELSLTRSLGLSSIIIVPINVEGMAVGAITLISSDQKRHYTHSDLTMANEVARRASVAMTNASLYHDAQKELAARRQLEEELRVANDELEARVAERTSQLESTNANLQRSNQELQDFAYVASHDLQEPLRKIQAFGNLLEDEYGDQLGEGRDYLQRMRGALKFHKPDVAPIVKIRATIDISQKSRQKYCRLEVEDNGVGFNEKYLDRIFAVFQRLHSRDSYEGTGIGLAVSRKIVERHGGSITARSKPGDGATFVITLPMSHKKGETL
jgi:PAS domain S-box-containing protein